MIQMPLLASALMLTTTTMTPDKALFQKPLIEKGVSQRFLPYHQGVDLQAGRGTEIRPVTAGVVKQVTKSWVGYGYHVIVDHGGGVESLYAHMAEIKVEEGQRVGFETVLGTVGLTGRTTGPHLHLEVRVNEENLNPESLFN